MKDPRDFATVDWIEEDDVMRPLKRKPVHKHSSAHKFRKDVGRTHPHNVKPMPMRGGWRL